jgi:uncharacterized membrane protein
MPGIRDNRRARGLVKIESRCAAKRNRPPTRTEASSVMDDVVVARALHVLAVVIWIGGVAMVTMVVLPAVRDGDVGPNRARVFEAIERRFTWPARIATVVVGLTGFYMTQRLELWDRFRSGEFWWMHAKRARAVAGAKIGR